MKKILLFAAMALELSISSKAQDATYYVNDDRIKWDINGSVNAPVTEAKTLYPNPAVSFTNVLLRRITDNPVQVLILDFNGVIRSNFSFDPGGNNLYLDISNLPKGLYVVQVKERGKEVQSLKLVKEE